MEIFMFKVYRKMMNCKITPEYSGNIIQVLILWLINEPPLFLMSLPFKRRSLPWNKSSGCVVVDQLLSHRCNWTSSTYPVLLCSKRKLVKFLILDLFNFWKMLNNVELILIYHLFHIFQLVICKFLNWVKE